MSRRGASAGGVENGEREEERVGKREGKTRAVPVASVASYTGQSLGRNQVLTADTSIQFLHYQFQEFMTYRSRIAKLTKSGPFLFSKTQVTLIADMSELCKEIVARGKGTGNYFGCLLVLLFFIESYNYYLRSHNSSHQPVTDDSMELLKMELSNLPRKSRYPGVLNDSIHKAHVLQAASHQPQMKILNIRTEPDSRKKLRSNHTINGFVHIDNWMRLVGSTLQNIWHGCSWNYVHVCI
jgi:hypothetical protein